MSTDSRVVIVIAMSLDGFVATEDGGVDWLESFDGAGSDYGFGALMERMGANIQGSVTYEQVLGFDVPYPYDTPSFVMTSRELDVPEGADVRFMPGDDPTAVVAAARDTTDSDIWLIGGGQTIRSCLDAALVDEIVISVMPVMLGSGIDLFPDGTPAATLSLLNAESFADGVVNLHYEVR